MTHPDLESARQKLARAQEHIEQLFAEQERWAEIRPHPYDVELRDDSSPDKILGVIGTLDQPPPFMSTILGDIVHNLRSTLDHVSWQLVKHGSAATLTKAEERQVQFPICETPESFEGELVRRLPGVDDIHEAIVRRTQPFHRGVAATQHPFAVLRRLSNDDKHRSIHLTYWCASTASFTVREPPIGCRPTEMISLVNLYKPLAVGMPLFQVTVAGDRALCKGMYVDSRFVYQVAFDDGSWVNNTVRSAGALTSDLLDEIDRVL